MRKAFHLASILIALAAAPLFAQKGPIDELGFHADKLYDFSGVDSVNLFNGNLVISIPIGPRYAVSSNLSYQFTLVFNGKTTDTETWLEYDPVTGGDTKPASRVLPSVGSNAGVGWRVSLGRLLPPVSTGRTNDSLDDDTWVYEGPAGDEHNVSVANPHDGMRMHVLSEEAIEIEFGSGEIHKFEIENAVWRLKQMRDRFGNAVNISYTYSLDGKKELAWTVTDTASRSHTVTFVGYLGMADGWSRGQTVSQIDLQGFNSATATYKFTYSGDSVPILTALAQPDGTEYDLTGNLAGVTQIRYPTGGTVSYEYGYYAFAPQDSICVIPQSWGVIRRTVSDGVSTTDRVWDYQQAMGLLVPVTTNVHPVCVEDGSLNGPFYWARRSILAPADGNSHRSRADTYFSIFTDAPGDGMGFVVTHPMPAQGLQAYGHPGAIAVPPASERVKAAPPGNLAEVDSRDEATSSARLLSTESYANCDNGGDCTNGTLLRTTYQRYAGSVIPKPQGGHAEDDTRLLSSRTVFNDDAGCGSSQTSPCYTQITNSDDNGAMHFKQTTLDSNFPNAQTVTTRTEYPDWSTADLSDFTKPWLLNVYTEKSRAENSVTSHEQFCFDTDDGSSSTGVLLRHRLLGGSTPLANDVLTVFDHDTSGNVQYTSSYGGDQSPRANDDQTVGTESDLCSAALPTHPAYKTKQTYTNGILASSQYYAGDTDQPLSFKSVDRDIDPSTGVVTAARDTTGLFATSFSYSAKPARLETMTLPTGATTTYTYIKATGSPGSSFTSAKVHSETPSSSGGTLKEEFVFDGIGRVIGQSHLGPQSSWFATETTFDEAGRVASVSQPESTGADPPSGPLTAAHKTTYKYDALGQMTLVTPPDNTTTHDTTTSTVYQGSRIRTKTSHIATGDTDSAVSTKEEYDHNGRLITVTEDASATALKTTYTYDIGNRLASVSTTSGGTQTREFHYDLRGFLLWEKHPELSASGDGKTIYGSSETSGSYDAGGHAHRKVTGAFDLTTDYDAAERVTGVKETGGRQLKLFAYDDPTGSIYGQCAGGKCKGKLAAAGRYNYAPDLGTVGVGETYQYDGVGGLPSRRDRSIGSSTTFDGQSFFFGQTNNDLGGVATLTYPCRTDANAHCLSADRTPPTITMGYSAGTLTSVGSYASNITYQPSGVIGTVTHGSGSTAVSEVWDSDGNGMARPSTIHAANASNTELWNSGSYSFDGSANIKAIGSTAYYYDPFDRLTGWKTPGTNGAYEWIGRQYDGFGNYLSAFEKVCMPQVSGQAQRCFTSNFATQQVIGTTNHYSGVTYDDAGDITAQSGRSFTWDSLGVMTGATANGRTFRYLYTPDDERIAVVERVAVSGVTRNRTTWSARDFDNRLLTTWTDDATSGTRTITWKEDEIWRGGNLLANVSSSGTKHYILDHLGSPRFITNASGQAVGPQNFAPFGSGGSSGSGTLEFAGMERDLTAVGGGFPDLPDYDHQRFYELDAGRFLSIDPILPTAAIHEPQRWNRYSYVSNNPMTSIDPTGKLLEVRKGLCDDRTPCYSQLEAFQAVQGWVGKDAAKFLALGANGQVTLTKGMSFAQFAKFGAAAGIVANLMRSTSNTAALELSADAKGGAFTEPMAGGTLTKINPAAFPTIMGGVRQTIETAMAHDLGGHALMDMWGISPFDKQFGSIDQRVAMGRVPAGEAFAVTKENEYRAAQGMDIRTFYFFKYDYDPPAGAPKP